VLRWPNPRIRTTCDPAWRAGVVTAMLTASPRALTQIVLLRITPPSSQRPSAPALGGPGMA